MKRLRLVSIDFIVGRLVTQGYDPYLATKIMLALDGYWYSGAEINEVELSELVQKILAEVKIDQKPLTAFGLDEVGLRVILV